MKKLIFHLIALPAMVLLQACNSDIFIDADIPERMDGTIDGDGGEIEFTIPTKDLENISLEIFSEQQKYCHYYNARGEEISSKSPASEVSRIIFETDYYKFEVLKNGRKITCRNICSTYRDDIYEDIRLDYSYGMRVIHIVVLPGKPLQLLEVRYDTPLQVTDNAEVKSTRFTVNNDGPLPSTFEVMPYVHENASVLVVPTKGLPLGYNQILTMEVPFYENGKWGFKEVADIEPGRKSYFGHPDRFLEIPVSIPAGAHVSVTTNVTYTKAEAEGTFFFLNEILDIRIPVRFGVTSLYPVSYEIETADAN